MHMLGRSLVLYVLMVSCMSHVAPAQGQTPADSTTGHVVQGDLTPILDEPAVAVAAVEGDDASIAPPQLYGGLDNDFAALAAQLREYKWPKNGQRPRSWAAVNKFAEKLLQKYVTAVVGIQSDSVSVAGVYDNFDAYLNDMLGKQGRGLTNAEWKLYNSNRVKALLCIANGKLAYDYALQNYQATMAVQEDGNGDAFRHALWNYGMAIDVGQTFAKQWSDAHEDFPNNVELKKQMDLFNNGVGLALAKDNPWTLWHSTFISKTKDKCRTGQLRIIINGALVASNRVGEK